MSLSVFGRPDAASACECERNNDANLAQALHLSNSDELLAKIGGKSKAASAAKESKDEKGKKKKGGEKKADARPAAMSGERLKQLLADRRPHKEKLRDLYVVALTREPSKEELASLLAHIGKKMDNVEEAYSDILWAKLNTKEFQFNHCPLTTSDNVSGRGSGTTR